MAYNTPPSVTTGQLATASDHNTYTKDNIIYLFAPTLQSKTSAYTVVVTDASIKCSGTFTLDLYPAAGNAGRPLEIINVGTGTITVDPNGSETIGGSATRVVNAGSALTLRCDGSNWLIATPSTFALSDPVLMGWTAWPRV